MGEWPLRVLAEVVEVNTVRRLKWLRLIQCAAVAAVAQAEAAAETERGFSSNRGSSRGS